MFSVITLLPLFFQISRDSLADDLLIFRFRCLVLLDSKDQQTACGGLQRASCIAKQAPRQPRNKAANMPRVQSIALLHPATRPSHLAAQVSAALGKEMEMMGVATIDEQALREVAATCSE